MLEYVFLIILIIARLLVQYWQFSKQDIVAIMFCDTMKSLAMGISIKNTFFENENQEMTDLLFLPVVIFHVDQFILGPYDVVVLKKWLQKELKKPVSTINGHQPIRSRHEDNLQLDEAENININC
jgi:predicted Na+-dependent transporter